MQLMRILIAVLVMVLSTGPALAANCVANCNHTNQEMTMKSVMDDMPDCHHAHQSAPEKQHTPSSDHCTKAGCHSLSTVAFLSLPSFLFMDSQRDVHLRFFPAAISADLSPPIKPPA